MTVKDPQQIDQFLAKARQELELIKRQTIISQFYKSDMLVVENAAARGAKTTEKLDPLGTK